ncbi:MAG: TrkH family potassium uptake protein [Syntrophomonas sp.]
MIRGAVVLSNLGRLVFIIGIAMLSCLGWSLAYHEDVTMPILQAAVLTMACGLLLKYAFSSPDNINFKEGFVLVSLGWIVVSGFGTLPYLFSGYLPSFADAWFETVSGFTTTGASIVKDVESWPKGLLFWRSLTHWLGGMGIIALFVAVINTLGARAKQLFKAEVPGPISDSISPRIRETARRLWFTYVVLSLLCALLLYLFGMDFFDALCHTFGTMATGGFSTKNTSIAFYSSPLIQWTIIFFMLMAGTNFALHYFAFNKHNPHIYLKNAEFKFYGLVILIATLLVFLDLNQSWSGLEWEATLRSACFQIVSIVTTTGYATVDYNLWPAFATTIVLLMMFVGGCSGSTGGGIKPGRYLIILLRTNIELKKMVHPKAVLPLRFGERFIKEDLVINVLQFFFLYFILLAFGMLVLSLAGLDLLSSLTATAACLGNIGPGLGLVGPTETFGFIPHSGKYVLSILMLIGRLELYPILVMLVPSFWKE